MFKKNRFKKGQISLDMILAIMFLLLVSVLIYQNVGTTTNIIKDSSIADKVYSIGDSFENYALLSYSKNINITMELKPIGNKNYTIYFAKKSISVTNPVNVTFYSNGNSVNVTGINVNKNSGRNIPDNIINISYDGYYVVKRTAILIN